MRFTGIGLVLIGMVIGVYYLTDAALAEGSGPGGSVVMPVSAAAAALAGAAILVFGGKGYTVSGIPLASGRASPGWRDRQVGTQPPPGYEYGKESGYGWRRDGPGGSPRPRSPGAAEWLGRPRGRTQ